MAYDLATVTNLGNQLLASVVSDKSSLVIDKIEVSGTQLASSTDLKSMTSISNVVQTLSANGYQKKDSSFIISTVLDNSSVTADYQAWVFGIWAHETGGGSPILMSVITSTSSPDTITKGSGTPVDYNYKFVTTFSNTSSLTIQMSSDTYANNDTVLHNSGDETATGTKTFQEIKISNDKFPSVVQTDGQYITLDGGNSELIPANDSKVVHTTGNETVDGKKTFKVDPVDGAGNAYAKTVDVNQQLDKKVNVSDMRKPANDVVGIEEVSTLQTQVDNSAVGTNLLTNSNFSSGLDNFGINTGTNSDCKGVVTTDSDGDTCVHITGTGDYCGLYLKPVYFNQNRVTTGSTLVKGTGKCRLVGLAYQPASNFGTVSTESYSKVGSTVKATSGANTFCVFFDTVNGVVDIYIKFLKLENGSHATDWCPNPEDKADDSKVAHLSGANNFDTTPTVNNNPLLLASSLPSTLADTTKLSNFTAGLQSNGTAVATSTDLSTGLATKADDSKVVHNTGTEEVAGQKTFDVAPIDKATGNPYITKDGVPAVPSTLADTTKPANFTAGLQSGGVSVATSDDLKSLENSAWHTVTLPDSQGLKSITMIYKIHDDEKYLEANIYAETIHSGQYSPTMLNLSGIVNKITSLDLVFISSTSNIFMVNGNTYGRAMPSFSSNIISLADNAYIYTDPGFVSIISDGNPNFAKIYYDSLVN